MSRNHVSKKHIAKKIIHDELFQGNLSKKNYFEGWYFKFVSKEGKHTFSLIPGISLKDEDNHSFVQYIDGKTGNSEYFRFDINEFYAEKKKFEVHIGENKFSCDSVEINLKNEKIHLEGKFSLSNIQPYPSTLLAPTIMGWFAYVPKMECNHGVVSMNHNVSGYLQLDKKKIDFNNGSGYIEKDWGTSFPKSWIWMQTNNFPEKELSFMLSVAAVPKLGRTFTGFLGFIYHKGEVYRFGTYTGAKIISYKQEGSELTLTLRNGKYLLKISAKMGPGSELIAPTDGKMERVIKESINSEIEIELRNESTDTLIIKETGTQAGLEISGDMNKMLK